MTPHRSSSSEQQAAEPLVLAALSETFGQVLSPTTFTLPGGARVDVDGAAPDRSLLVEVYARQGRLKGGQPKKVASDALKLITVARTIDPHPRLVVAFADGVAASCVTGQSWLAEALRTWGVEPVVVEVDPAIRARVVEAQLRQQMINPPDTDG